MRLNTMDWDDRPEAYRPAVQFFPGNGFKRMLYIVALIVGTIIYFFYGRYPQYHEELGFNVIRTPGSHEKFQDEIESLLNITNLHQPEDNNRPDGLWTWTCEDGGCKRSIAQENVPPRSLQTCNMLCSKCPIWPHTSSKLETTLSQNIVKVRADDMKLEIVHSSSKDVTELITGAFELFKQDVLKQVKDKDSQDLSSARSIVVKVSVPHSADAMLLQTTPENYGLIVNLNDTVTVIANVVGDSFYAARHGFETLSQLIWYDTTVNSLVTFDNVFIEDEPKFFYRGLLLDTARHYFPVEDIKRTLDAMAASKLNTFHWHATDSQSFPLKLNSVPQMASYGSYSKREVYTTDDIKEIVRYARLRGIRVLIEIDVPAHVGYGWSWGKKAGLGDLAYCVETHPWRGQCGEPPCGQLNPHNENVNELLLKIYTEIIELTGVYDLFHIGGDEVNMNCWRSHMPNENPKEAWYNFMQNVTGILKKANKGKLPNNVIVWSSKLTEEPYVSRMMHYTVQLWGSSKWDDMMSIADSGMPVVVSHVNGWYLDCGYGSWRDAGNSHCGYCDWQTVYDHRPWAGRIWNMLGGEACLWTEQVDPSDLDARLWPRAAAVGERLWSDPDQESNMPDVKIRLDMQRTRLVNRGIAAAPLWTRWCTENYIECL